MSKSIFLITKKPDSSSSQKKLAEYIEWSDPKNYKSSKGISLYIIDGNQFNLGFDMKNCRRSVTRDKELWTELLTIIKSNCAESTEVVIAFHLPGAINNEACLNHLSEFIAIIDNEELKAYYREVHKLKRFGRYSLGNPGYLWCIDPKVKAIQRALKKGVDPTASIGALWDQLATYKDQILRTIQTIENILLPILIDVTGILEKDSERQTQYVTQMIDNSVDILKTYERCINEVKKLKKFLYEECCHHVEDAKNISDRMDKLIGIDESGNIEDDSVPSVFFKNALVDPDHIKENLINYFRNQDNGEGWSLYGVKESSTTIKTFPEWYAAVMTVFSDIREKIFLEDQPAD